MPARKETALSVLTGETLKCYHCGDVCRDEPVRALDKAFCCEGCKLVFEILQDNNLCNYYQLNPNPGVTTIKGKNTTRYDFLDEEKVKQQLISFTDGNLTHITLLIPQIHCSSCIWLLEHLYKLEKGVKRSTVNFLKREVHIVFSEQETSLRKIAELLDRIGYTPHISLGSLQKNKQVNSHKTIYYKLGISFFSFGNIMLLSFPEYFGLSGIIDKDFRYLFGFLNILLSLPVLLYADTDFFKSAVTGLRQGRLNMDFPISLGIVAMYSRSLYEILSGTGAGYMDTFAALIFFMLSGRFFQNKSYERLSFDRDYKSYFPVSITTIRENLTSSKTVSEIRKGDRILIRNEELIPVDAILIKGEANIDYSFVTGENIPVHRKAGDKIYAGGKQLGSAIELEVISEVSQSRLTQLWNESNYKKADSNNILTVTDQVSKYFTITVVMLAIAAGAWYAINDQPAKALNAFTAILIITCPCALALSYPFTLGNSIRIMGKNRFYLKNTAVIEKMAKINTIVFDKTGTLTKAGQAEITYRGRQLSGESLSNIHSLTAQSNHPLSRLLSQYLEEYPRVKVQNYTEIPGKGIEGNVNNMDLRLGSAIYAGQAENDTDNHTRVHVNINGRHEGVFTISSIYREGLHETTQQLSKNYELHLISGDNHSERKSLAGYFENGKNLQFEQSPAEKLSFIKNLQSNNKNVMMFGDGLNDSGALLQSDVGVAVSDNVNNFSPASDGILDASAFSKIPSFLKFAHTSMKIIYTSYAVSFLYNCVGIYFAIQGNLSPVIAAIIMPLSTITIILFTTLATNFASVFHQLNQPGSTAIKNDE